MGLVALDGNVGPANRERGEVDFVVNEKRYRIRGGTNALIRLESVSKDAEGKPERAVDVQERLQRGRETMADYRNLLWSMLQEFHPTSTLADAGDLIDELARLGETRAQELLAEAFAAGGPEPSESDPPAKTTNERKGKKKTRRHGGTGEGSTATPDVTGS